ncbi:HTH_Tnp_Tc3_2 domain-containing protein [Trichonephila clavipes]|nr:HTH_Tnp_Tc3_2 domain-containing protein [Trichonephila clavipes]
MIDIAPRKRSKIIVLNEHTSMTVRDKATAVGVDESRILRTFQDSRSSSLKRGVKMRAQMENYSQKSNKILIKNRKINRRKSISDLQRYLLGHGVGMGTSPVRKKVYGSRQ